MLSKIKKIIAHNDIRLKASILRDERLKGKMSLGELKTYMIKQEYIEHVEGDMFIVIKKWKNETLINELLKLGGN